MKQHLLKKRWLNPGLSKMLIEYVGTSLIQFLHMKKKKSTGLLIINVFKIIFPKISHDWKEIYLEQNLYKIFKLKHL